MVKRSYTRILSRCTSTVLVIAVSWATVAGAESTEDGAAALQRFDAAETALRAAMAQGDGATAETQSMEATSALAAASNAFKKQYDQSQGLEDALGYLRALRLKHDYDLAAEFAEEALRTHGESAGLWREYGTNLLHLGKKKEQEAVDALYGALARDAQSADAVVVWDELGFYYLSAGIPTSAAQAFEAALAIDGGDVRARLGQVVVSVYAGAIAEASEGLKALGREAQPFDTMLRTQLRRALTDFDTHRRTFSDRSENHFAYARILYFAARLPEAVMAAQRAARLAESDSEIWGFLIAIQMQLGDYPGAQASCEASLRANPDQPDVQQTLEKLKVETAKAAASAPQAPTALSGQGPLR